MKQVSNLPPGIEIFTNILSFDEAESLIDRIEGSTQNKVECKVDWGIPQMHSPDVSCLRRNSAIAISEHTYLNASCSCGLREVDSLLGKNMLKCLEAYVSKYDLGLTQDEGFFCVKHGPDHVDMGVVDDNAFVNRVVSMHFPLNIDGGTEYIKFKNFGFTVNLNGPALVMFPSSFAYAYEKPFNEGLYEIQNFFNNNPSQEFFDQVFGGDEVSITQETPDLA
jgi:hypothetical protein